MTRAAVHVSVAGVDGKLHAATIALTEPGVTVVSSFSVAATDVTRGSVLVLTPIQVEATLLDSPPSPEMIAAVDSEPLSEYELDLIRKLRGGTGREDVWDDD